MAVPGDCRAAPAIATSRRWLPRSGRPLRNAACRASAVTPRGIFTDDHGGWSYTSVLAEAADPFAVHSDDDETDEVAWVAAPRVAALELHPGLAAHWPELQAELSPLTIIVDGANVVGSRPDGWWRDRAGAARRLRDELAPLVGGGISTLPDGLDAPASGGPVEGRPARRIATMAGGQTLMRWLPGIVLVVEGAARPAAANPGDSPVRMVAASGSGDDAIAALAGQIPGRRIVVTADRELRDRCRAAGASVAGPSWLLGLR